jgi:hypothetical protein
VASLPRDAWMTDETLTPRERRLRRGLVGLAMLCAALALLVAAVLIYWRLYLLGPSGDPFTRGPFIYRLGTDEAALSWRVDGDRPVELTATGPDGTVTATGGRFTGLTPGTRYVWTASVGGLGRASGSFRTAPLDLSEPIRFGVIGDYGSGNNHEWAVGRTLAAERPDFVTTAGDNSYLVSAPQVLDRNIFEPLHDVMLGAPLWATEGEHDLIYAGGAAVTSALHLPGPHGRYAVRYGPVQLVLLGLQAGAEEIAFARRALAEPGPLVRFVVVHRPVQQGNPILPLLRRTGVAAIMAGHLHRYERRTVGGVPEFTVGSSGEGPGAAEFTKATPSATVSLLDYGCLLVEVSSADIRYTYVDERGRVRDHWSERRP